jgi:hypothetical protein
MTEPRPFRVNDAEMACLNKYGGGPWFESYQEDIGHGGSDRDIGNGVSGRFGALCAGDGGEARHGECSADS